MSTHVFKITGPERITPDSPMPWPHKESKWLPVKPSYSLASFLNTTQTAPSAAREHLSTMAPSDPPLFPSPPVRLCKFQNTTPSPQEEEPGGRCVPCLGSRSTRNPQQPRWLGGVTRPAPSPPIVPTESPARSPLLTRLASREKGRRPGPRPAGTSSSSPPSSPCQEAAHPPRSSHCRGQDGGAGARGWDRESEGLWR